MMLCRLSFQQLFALCCCVASISYAYRLTRYATTISDMIIDGTNSGHMCDKKSSSTCTKLSLVKSYAGLLDSTGPISQQLLSASKSVIVEAEGSGNPCRIKVIGVGGGGGNAVNRMLDTPAGTSQN